MDRRLALALLLAVRAHAQVALDSHQNGQSTDHPVVLLEGRAAPGAAVAIVHQPPGAALRAVPSVTRGGRFLAVAELAPGENCFHLSAGGQALAVRLHHRRADSHAVRLVYFTDASGDTRYSTPLPGDRQDHVAKIETIGLLMQAFASARLGRSFRLARDAAGRTVQVIRGQHPRAHYQALDSVALWHAVRAELAPTRPPATNDAVVLAFTR
jgi:hypothetical protein